LNLPIVAVAIIGVALFFDFINGFHDSSNVVATMISSRAMSARKALALSAVAHFCGPFLFGMAVAKTIGHDVVDPKAITMAVIFAALLAAIVWNIVTWAFGIPSSSSHALVGGLIGAVSVDFGFAMIQMRGLLKVIIALFMSPILGLIVGHLLMRLVLFLARGASPRINWAFKRGQIITSLALALSQGTNNAQMTMGIIAMSLVTSGHLPEFSVPWWVVAFCAGAMSLGTVFGGWRIIRTLGGKFYTIRPVHGFTAQIASALIIFGAAFLGGPVSTTQVVSSAILGVGSARRVSRVRWNVAGNILTAWLLTVPASALLAALLYLLIRFLWQS